MKNNRIIVIAASLVLIVIFASANYNEVIKNSYVKFKTQSVDDSLSYLYSKIKNKFLFFISNYSEDMDYWTYENKNNRINLQDFYIEAGTGVVDNYLKSPLPQGEIFSSFTSSWNQKNYNIDSYTPLLNGEKIWTYTSKRYHATQMIPVYKDGGILINDGVSKLTKLDSITGKIIWSRTFPESPVAKRGLIIHNNTVFFPSGNMLRAIDFTSGKDENIFNNSPNIELETLSFIEPKIWNKSKLIAVSNDAVIYIIDINLGKVVQQSAIVSDAEPARAGSLDSIYKNPRIWGGVALDDARGILYLTTSNPSPTLVGVDRPGKNKYSSSIVAFDLVKSVVIWDFQDVAHDLWDYDIAAPPVLAQIPINDKKMDVVVAIGKTGNIYVLDRDTGKSVHNLKYIRAPVSKVLGEKTSPYQKYSIKPENLLGFYNTEVLIGGEWKKIFFEPPRIDEYIKVKGLHGGVNWPGFAASNDKVLVAVSQDKTLIALKDSNLGSVEDLIRNPECDGCHNNKIQKDISTFFGTRTREDFSNIILNGYQGMPAQKVEAGRLSKIVDYLVVKNGTSRDHLKSVDKSLVKKRYIKSKKDKTQTAELILLDIGKGEILWRLPIDKNEYGLTLAGTAFINNSYGVVTGGLDKKVLIVDIGSSKVSTEIQLDYIGSATPLTFQNENSVFMLIPETGSSTLNRYDKAKLIGNKFTLYKIGSID